MDEKLKILDMLKEGKLNTKEAEKLLKALGADRSERPEMTHYPKTGAKNNLKGKLKIIVDSAEGENVPNDPDLADRVFQAALELAVETGV